ncbi:hypothetical protein PIL02S_03104 [Paenibacillus illinoisensis]|uniref:Uncharacterized protein n=1 Tax=Paenibacillus illinoisensis TaxID=59845 RepID=A0A2W0CJI6_9BACL|nr:hypothetical protein PIL02S_03104 [Paenibacillus illinoisensis]
MQEGFIFCVKRVSVTTSRNFFENGELIRRYISNDDVIRSPELTEKSHFIIYTTRNKHDYNEHAAVKEEIWKFNSRSE